MNSKSPQSKIKKLQTVKVEIDYSYDSINMDSIKQHEIMLMSIHNFWRDEIKAGYLFVSSVEQKSLQLNTITIRLTSIMSEKVSRQLLEAMNLAAYYATHPDKLVEQYEAAAKFFKPEMQ